MSIEVGAQSLRFIATAVVASVGFMMFLVISAASAAEPAPKPLTNGDIVAMVQAGLPTDVVVEKIKTTTTAFDTSTDALVALRKVGVGSDIIRVMVNPAAELRIGNAVSPWANGKAPEPCQVTTGIPAPWLSGASPAMWYRDPDKGDRVELNYERGTITHVGYAGFGASLLVLHPLRANVRIGSRSQFLSCINPTDAPLVRFSLDSEGDERNTSVGRTTPWSTSFRISEEDLVPFKSEKTPEGYFKITFSSPLVPGEYGFVPQGSTGYFVVGERVYAFGVD
jgi:hypothetical protein